MFSTPPWCLPSPSATSRSIRKARPYPLSQPSTQATEPSLPTWPSCPPTTEASTPSPQTPPTSSSTSQATSPPRGRSSWGRVEHAYLVSYGLLLHEFQADSLVFRIDR